MASISSIRTRLKIAELKQARQVVRTQEERDADWQAFEARLSQLSDEELIAERDRVISGHEEERYRAALSNVYDTILWERRDDTANGAPSWRR